MALDTPAAVVLELMTMGQQSAAHLGDLLRATAPQGGHHHELAAKILRCCGRVIAALTAGAGKKRKAPEYDDQPAADASRPVTAMPPTKRRARGGEALTVVRTSTVVDGFIWRKYGQKEINGREHPRLYYRCAHRHEGCNATRRVQRTQGDAAAAYEIAYYGEHTCRGAAACHAAAAPPAVVDVGSNAAGAGAGAGAWGWGSGGSPAGSEQRWSWDGEASSQGWSSSSASSEVWSEAQPAHEWHDTGSAARAEEPPASAAATPCHDSPVLQFLDGCFDWESVLVNDPFDFGGLPHVAALQY
ncbi:hypothetical protein ACP4OV_019605 [Aristida adscensionis]